MVRVDGRSWREITACSLKYPDVIIRNHAHGVDKRMNAPPTSNDDTTPHSIAIPSMLWYEWKAGRSRWSGEYERLTERIAELIALDVWARHEHGIGVVEHLAQERYRDTGDDGELSWRDINRLCSDHADPEDFPDLRRKVEREKHTD